MFALLPVTFDFASFDLTKLPVHAIPFLKCYKYIHIYQKLKW